MAERQAKQDPRPNDLREQLLTDLPVAERTLELAGVTTTVLEGGDGPPVVLLHGPGESSFWWMRVIPDLVTTHRVVVPDLPGHGASEVVDNALDADSVNTWLGELVDETCSTPPTLVGHLLGGAIAARFASERDARLRRLVLVDSLGLGRFLPSPRFAFGLVRFLVRPTDRAYHRFLDQCMIDRDGLIQQMGDDWEPFLEYNLERARTPSVKAAMRTLMREVGVPRIPEANLEQIPVPTFLIWGRDDRAVRLGIAERANSRYGWPLHVVDDAGDDPKLERPEAFLEALYDVLEGRAADEELAS
ncbi:alpha/beta fold hydrolase [Haloarchaeobius sp. HRN-SO-5]|uniref:alpha/beta fold hydrolase n=1 Tax=Haloarchaeobius sp. HRN-SO-5 TaxID=3446118 RepID=UPI003EBAA5EE